MKKLIYIFITLIATTIVAACDDSDLLSDMSGVWRVDSYEIDGVSQVGLCERTTFSFQKNVVSVVVIYDEYQTYNTVYGTWSCKDATFTFDFSHHDNNSNQGTGPYSAPAWLGMISDEPMEMTVVEHSSKGLSLEWLSPNGATQLYKLHKNI